jgi:predicted enzyme related to lactoylglutathione lyase
VPSVSSHAPGRFCWVELATSDQPAAKVFYGGLFGWEPRDQPMGPNEFYTLMEKSGRDAAAAYTLRPDQKGVPPHWLLYVAVERADAAAARAKDLGASVLAPPFDVMDSGRMAVLQDPTGAVFAVWEARRHPGLGVVEEPGAFCWAELLTRDTSKAQSFYEALFGWATGGDARYTEWKSGDRSIGGMMEIQKDWGDVPPHWLVYFQVENVDRSIEKAKALGATLTMGPQDMPEVGRFAMLRDPQGAAFYVFQPAPGAGQGARP